MFMFLFYSAYIQSTGSNPSSLHTDVTEVGVSENAQLIDFVRMSLDLRGRGPSVEEVKVLAQPQLTTFVDDFLMDLVQSRWDGSEFPRPYRFLGRSISTFWRLGRRHLEIGGLGTHGLLQLLIEEERSYLDWVSLDDAP